MFVLFLLHYWKALVKKMLCVTFIILSKLTKILNIYSI